MARCKLILYVLCSVEEPLSHYSLQVGCRFWNCLSHSTPVVQCFTPRGNWQICNTTLPVPCTWNSSPEYPRKTPNQIAESFEPETDSERRQTLAGVPLADGPYQHYADRAACWGKHKRRWLPFSCLNRQYILSLYEEDADSGPRCIY